MSLYRRRSGIQETQVDGDLFLVLPETGEIYHLNSVGAALWRLLAEPTTEETAMDMLAVAFPDLPPATITADVRHFLNDLDGHALLDAA
jgi:hypothetical protein